MLVLGASHISYEEDPGLAVAREISSGFLATSARCMWGKRQM